MIWSGFRSEGTGLSSNIYAINFRNIGKGCPSGSPMDAYDVSYLENGCFPIPSLGLWHHPQSNSVTFQLPPNIAAQNWPQKSRDSLLHPQVHSLWNPPSINLYLPFLSPIIPAAKSPPLHPRPPSPLPLKIPIRQNNLNIHPKMDFHGKCVFLLQQTANEHCTPPTKNNVKILSTFHWSQLEKRTAHCQYQQLHCGSLQISPVFQVRSIQSRYCHWQIQKIVLPLHQQI